LLKQFIFLFLFYFYSNSQELQMSCMARGFNYRVDCRPVADGRYEATVVINNMTFVGSVARTKEQAVESAATNGLFNSGLFGFVRNGFNFSTASNEPCKP
jgi:hypothetical protein